MAFTAQDVKTLREMTNVGMMDCKKALQATDGDMDKAVDWLREKGLAKAAKKAGRVAAEGMAYAHVCSQCGVAALVEVNCETDFCAKSEAFVQFVKDICKVVMNDNPADVDALLQCKYPERDLTVAEILPEKVMSIGENLQIRRFVRFADPVNVAYVHAGGSHGVLVNLAVEGEHFATDMIPDPVPFRLQVFCHTAFGHQVFVNPGIFHRAYLLYFSKAGYHIKHDINMSCIVRIINVFAD